MTAAVVLTVKNEARLLPQHIAYHLGIGVKQVFVYFDNTTDTGKEEIQHLPNVIARNSITPAELEPQPYLQFFFDRSEAHHTARQCLNTYHALQCCKQMGIDWLISIDADELLLTPEKGEMPLVAYLQEAASQQLDVIQLAPMEMVNRQLHYKQVMAEETLFKTQKNFKSKFDQVYRRIYDPYTKTYLKSSYWLGHTMGKAVLRVNANILPKSVHRYQHIDNRPLKQAYLGHVLHYHVYDITDFIKKYKNFKNRSRTFLSGTKIEPLKQLWIRLVNDPDYSYEALEAYYKTYVLYHKKALAKLYKTRVFNILKRQQPAVVEIHVPKRILKNN